MPSHSCINRTVEHIEACVLANNQQLTSVSYLVLQEAPAAGIPVHQRSLGSAEVKACMMSNLYLMLMLVDKSKLGSWSPTWGDSAYSDKHSYTGARADISVHC